MKSKNSKRVTAILLMLVLCVLATVYILHGARVRMEQAEQARIEQEQEEAARQAAEEAAAAETETVANNAGAPERVYSYRGSSSDHLYSMASYDNAVSAGTGFISVPFVVSQDGTLFVADDDESQALTGYSGFFSGMTDAQIGELETNDGEKLVKLSDLIDKYGKDVFYIIELKYTSTRNIQALEYLIRNSGMEDNTAISSMYFSGLRTIDGEMPDIPKIFICADEGEFNEALGLAQVDVIAVDKDMMLDEYCKAAHDAGKKFSIRNLNTEEDIKAAIAMGADSYFTDETALAVGIEKNQ